MFPLGLMQINSLSTFKSLRSLFLFIIFSTLQTDYSVRINILINNSPIVRVQKAYFLEACLGNSTSLLSTIVLAIFCKSRRYLPSDTLKLYIILSLTISLLQSGVVRAKACVAGGIGGGELLFFWRGSARAAKSLGASQIEIFPSCSYHARNNPASYASYPYNHPISSPPRTNSKPLFYKLNIVGEFSLICCTSMAHAGNTKYPWAVSSIHGQSWTVDGKIHGFLRCYVQ